MQLSIFRQVPAPIVWRSVGATCRGSGQYSFQKLHRAKEHLRSCLLEKMQLPGRGG